MKRIVFLLAALIFINITVFAADDKSAKEVTLPSIFIWAIPSEEDNNVPVKNEKKSKKQEIETEDLELNLMPDEETPIELKTTTLKGYTEYVEGADDVLYMDDHTKFVINLKTPQKITSQEIVPSAKIVPDRNAIYAIGKFKGEEYSISPQKRNFIEQDGKWSFGTTFNQEISTSQLENATSLFTKYENKYFSLSSSYKKNNMTITQIQTDNFSVIPELKFNNIFAIQEVLSADMTRNRRSSELVFSINPLGKKDTDRMRFNIGAKQTFDVNTGNTWSQLNFTTNFKL